VAIKVLADHMADRADVRERFEHEARTIAGLNHPYICVLYNVGHQADVDYLVRISGALRTHEYLEMTHRASKWKPNRRFRILFS
jgi:hypothetical protein